MLCRISLEITHEFTPRINLKNFWPSQWSSPGILIRLSLICVSQSGFRERKAKSGLQSKMTDRTSLNFGALDMVLARKRLTPFSLGSAWRDGAFSVETLERIRPHALFFNTRGTLGPDPWYQWSKQFSNIKIFNEISKFYNRTCIKHSFTSNWLACCSCIIFVLTIQRSKIIDSVEEIHEVK